MQWVVSTGRTVAEARDRALEALGIDDADLECEVLDEPGTTLFGLRATDARVRARVRPTRPRPKVDRRNRRKTDGSGRGGRRKPGKRPGKKSAEKPAKKAAKKPAKKAAKGSAEEAAKRSGTTAGGPGRSSGSTDAPAASPSPDAATDRPADREPDRPRPERTGGPRETDNTSDSPTGATGATMSDDIPLADQQTTAVGFVEGLVEAFGVDADIEASTEDDTLEIEVNGDDLGLLVGPRGATLNAVQELTRTAVAQQHSGRLEGRLRVDVAGYRARRKEALIRFVGDQADRVRETQQPVALEPMAPPDRKIVHDAVNELDGVRTTSEGEDRRRHVVIHPDD